MFKHHVTVRRLTTPVVAVTIAILAAGLITMRPTHYPTAWTPNQASAGIDPYALQLTIKSLPTQETGDLF
jgi:hypothetical protein